MKEDIESDEQRFVTLGADFAGGGNSQTLVNQALREHIQIQEGTLERTLRKVIREELSAHAD